VAMRYYGNVSFCCWRCVYWACYRCILHLQQYSHRLNLFYFYRTGSFVSVLAGVDHLSVPDTWFQFTFLHSIFKIQIGVAPFCLGVRLPSSQYLEVFRLNLRVFISHLSRACHRVTNRILVIFLELTNVISLISRQFLNGQKFPALHCVRNSLDPTLSQFSPVRSHAIL